MPGPIDWLMNLRYGKKNDTGVRPQGQDIQLPAEAWSDPRLHPQGLIYPPYPGAPLIRPDHSADKLGVEKSPNAEEDMINQLQRRNQVLGGLANAGR